MLYGTIVACVPLARWYSCRVICKQCLPQHQHSLPSHTEVCTILTAGIVLCLPQMKPCLQLYLNPLYQLVRDAPVAFIVLLAYLFW